MVIEHILFITVMKGSSMKDDKRSALEKKRDFVHWVYTSPIEEFVNALNQAGYLVKSTDEHIEDIAQVIYKARNIEKARYAYTDAEVQEVIDEFDKLGYHEVGAITDEEISQMMEEFEKIGCSPIWRPTDEQLQQVIIELQNTYPIDFRIYRDEMEGVIYVLHYDWRMWQTELEHNFAGAVAKTLGWSDEIMNVEICYDSLNVLFHDEEDEE